jgi:methylphosphotriester-DNA--protein-cysteine methyltransferase
MIRHFDINPIDLRKKIRQRQILFAGNANLEIYGNLGCKSGKRMKKQNRVFFGSEKEALEDGYRPCGNCLNTKYKNWKNAIV